MTALTKRLRSKFYVVRWRSENRWRDLRAVLAGYCNHCPKDRRNPMEGGGWTHWRCALRRGHEGLHRARNYTWADNGRSFFDPVPHGQRMPDQPWDRHLVDTRRQARGRRRHADALRARLDSREAQL